MDSKRKPVTRTQLHDLVWSVPLTKVAQDLGTKASEIRRICDHILHVPRPDSGYWSRIRKGEAPDRTPLPAPTPKTPQSVKVAPYQQPRPPLRVLIKRAVAEAAAHLPHLSVALTLEDPHPQIAARLAESGGKATLSKLQMRTHCIEDAFLKCMEKRGHRLQLSKNETFSRSFLVGDELITYTIYEPSFQRRVLLSAKELAQPWNVAHGKNWRQVLVPSGNLRFAINVGYRREQKWEDTKNQSLESQLGAIVIAMEVIAAETVRNRNEREKQSTQFQKELDRKLHPVYQKHYDDARWERLHQLASDRRQAELVRSFLSALAKAASNDEKLAAKAKQLTLSVQGYLRQLDPLSDSPKDVFRILDKPVPSPSDLDLMTFLS
ncbi:MAG: hypothetical protein QM647_08810 [Asticcacaulis sp.]|uniref:hypothetical protein n=1 Tax=Asticcacaulis sp. TaxID=1872648 RepID=UPI0039E26460